MDTRLNDIQQDLVDSAMAVLEKKAPLESIDQVIQSPDGYDRDLHALFVELGWTYLGWEYDEESTLVELGLVVNRLGYFGVPTPFRATSSAAYLASLASAGQAELLTRISEGEASTVVDLTTNRHADGPLVEWASAAATLVVVTRAGDEIVVREVPAVDATIIAVDVFDSERTARVSVPEGAGEIIGRLGIDAWERWRAVDRLLRSADILGAAQRSMDMTVENAKNRHQFGRPIGSFQALQHQAANMRMDTEACSLLIWSGLWRAVTGNEFVRHSLMAAWQTSESGQRISKAAVQLHGGIGFIKEYPLHHLYRRTKAHRLRFGPHRQLQRELGNAVVAAAQTGDFRREFVNWPES